METYNLQGLYNLKKGDKVKVIGIFGNDKPYRKKLLTMGITNGAEIEMIRKAPFGDPIQIKVKGTLLSLRSKEAEVINITSIL